MEAILHRRFTLIAVAIALIGVLVVQSVQPASRQSGNAQLIELNPGSAHTEVCPGARCAIHTAPPVLPA